MQYRQAGRAPVRSSLAIKQQTLQSPSRKSIGGLGTGGAVAGEPLRALAAEVSSSAKCQTRYALRSLTRMMKDWHIWHRPFSCTGTTTGASLMPAALWASKSSLASVKRAGTTPSSTWDARSIPTRPTGHARAFANRLRPPGPPGNNGGARSHALSVVPPRLLWSKLLVPAVERKPVNSFLRACRGSCTWRPRYFVHPRYACAVRRLTPAGRTGPVTEPRRDASRRHAAWGKPAAAEVRPSTSAGV